MLIDDTLPNKMSGIFLKLFWLWQKKEDTLDYEIIKIKHSNKITIFLDYLDEKSINMKREDWSEEQKHINYKKFLRIIFLYFIFSSVGQKELFLD